MGSSHQNVKQILNKLKQRGFLELVEDEQDRRKQRVQLTAYCKEFCEKNDAAASRAMEQIFRDISGEELAVTIRTISKMERNVQDNP